MFIILISIIFGYKFYTEFESSNLYEYLSFEPF